MVCLYAYIEQMSQQSWVSQQSHTTLTQNTNPSLKEEQGRMNDFSLLLLFLHYPTGDLV